MTFAVSEAARRFAADRTTIHMAGGVYSAASGESFPIEMAQNMSLRGVASGRSILRFERALADGFEVALSGGEELSDFTLQGRPRDLGGCYASAGIVQNLGTTTIHDVTVEAAPGTPAGDVAFGTGMLLTNEALVERTTVSGCDSGIHVDHPLARVDGCTLTDNRSGVSMAAGRAVSNCTLSANGSGVWAGGTVNLTDNTITGCYRALIGGATVSGNALTDNARGILAWVGNSLIENNIIRTSARQVGLMTGMSWPESRRTSASTTTSRPEIRNNRFTREPRRPLWPAPLAAFGGASRPVLAANRFLLDGADPFAFIEVHHDALPDFGSGTPESPGGNRFLAGWMVFYQDVASGSKAVSAQDNVWSSVPPRQGSGIRDEGDWFVDPNARRTSVRLDTTGARLGRP